MKPKPGRPAENRVKMTIHVLSATRRAIMALVRKQDGARNTQGKVIDQAFAK